MNGNELMVAIGNINDKYVMAFSQEETLKVNHSIAKKIALPIAACLCIVVSATILLKNNNNTPSIPTIPTIPTPVPSTGEQIWGDGITDNEVESSSEQAAKGKIIIADSLKNAMHNSKNKNDVFAIMVAETSGANKEKIYNSFVLPLGVEEDYMKSGLIFATAEQIKSFECPSNLSIVLFLAEKPHEDVVVNESVIESNNVQKMKVKVYLKYNADEILLKHQGELSPLKDEAYQIKQQEIIKAEVAKMLKEFIEDYDIAEESVSYLDIYIPKFSAELDTELILKIKDDDRVELVLEDTEIAGFDQVQ